MARSSVYWKPFLLKVTSALRVLPADLEVGEDHLGDGVVVPVVVRRELVRPHERAIAGLPREDARGPLVVAGALLGVVGRRVADAVVDQIELGVVGHPSPHRRAADLSSVSFGQLVLPELRALVVERLESPGLDQHVGVGTDVAAGPDDLAGLEIEPLHPAVDAELAARGADDDAILDDERRHRRRLALADVGDLGLPQLLAGLGIHRDRVPVEQVVDDLAVGVERAAVDHVAAGDADAHSGSRPAGTSTSADSLPS